MFGRPDGLDQTFLEDLPECAIALLGGNYHRMSEAGYP
jgi:hypothetical protein